MINEEIVKKAADAGLPSLKELFQNLSKEDALKGIGLLIVLGVTKLAFETVRDIVLRK